MNSTKMCLPEELKHIIGLAPQVDANVDSDIICLKNAKRAWVQVIVAQANAAIPDFTIYQCTDVSNSLSDNKALSGNCEIWYNADVSAADTLTRGTAAKTYSFSADLANKVCWFQLDLATCLDLANDFDCIYVTSGGSNAANIISVNFYLDSKYAEDVLPAAITD
jgi:hypothetical protein